MAKLSDRISGSPATYVGRNELINAAFEINQENFGGGQPAANVYGYDMWRGDVLGTRIEQTVENTFPLNGSYTISWVGGTGTADVNGVTGLSSGDTFTLTAAGNYSVIVPTDATFIKLEQGINQTPFSTQGTSVGAELALCQRHYETGRVELNAAQFAGNPFGTSTEFSVQKRVAPTVQLNVISSVNLTSPIPANVVGSGFTLFSTVISGTPGGCQINVEYKADARIYS